MTAANRAYLDLPANDRLEIRLPRRLKLDAEAVARANGQTLSQWLLAALAERTRLAYADTLQWSLTPGETAELARVLAMGASPTAALQAAGERADAMFGPLPGDER